MRSLVEVIDKIVEAKPELRDKLQATRDSATFAAPECMAQLWTDAAELLTSVAPNDEQIRAIFCGA